MRGRAFVRELLGSVVGDPGAEGHETGLAEDQVAATGRHPEGDARGRATAGIRHARQDAARDGRTEEEFIAGVGSLLTPETAGPALLGLVREDPAGLAPGYLLTAAGLEAPG